MLNDKQKRFCEEYVIDLNGAQAAIRAGYSEKTARTIAAQLLAKLNVKDYISSLQEQISKATNITAEKVLRELAKIAFSDISDYLSVKKGNIKLNDWAKLTKGQTSVIESIQQNKDGIRFKLYNKPQALELIGKHLGMFIEQNAPEDEISLPPDIDNMQPEEINKLYASLRQRPS